MRICTFAVCLIAVSFSSSFAQNVPVAVIGEDGIIQLAMPEADLLHAMNRELESGQRLTDTWQPLTRVTINEGPVTYLVGETDFFSIAYECTRRGDSYVINPDGVTHSCTASHCGVCGFRRSADGEIIGCYCAVKAREATSLCNHTISTPQTDFADYLLRMQDAKDE